MTTRVHTKLDTFVKHSIMIVPDNVSDLVTGIDPLTAFTTGMEILAQDLATLQEERDEDRDPTEEAIEIFLSHLSFSIGLVNEMMHAGIIDVSLEIEELLTEQNTEQGGSEPHIELVTDEEE